MLQRVRHCRRYHYYHVRLSRCSCLRAPLIILVFIHLPVSIVISSLHVPQCLVPYEGTGHGMFLSVPWKDSSCEFVPGCFNLRVQPEGFVFYLLKKSHSIWLWLT